MSDVRLIAAIQIAPELFMLMREVNTYYHQLSDEDRESARLVGNAYGFLAGIRTALLHRFPSINGPLSEMEAAWDSVDSSDHWIEFANIKENDIPMNPERVYRKWSR